MAEQQKPVPSGPTTITDKPKPPAPSQIGGVQPPATTEPGQSSETKPTNWYTNAEVFLDANGWERCGENERGKILWRDPLGTTAKAAETHIRDLPAVGGGTMPLKQGVLGPTPWEHVTEAAVSIQRARNEERAKQKAAAAREAEEKKTAAA